MPAKTVENPMTDELSDLLSESPETARARAAGEFDRLASPFSRRLVISGTGHLGMLALSGLRSSGVEPLAFCDNNSALWGESVDGLTVLSPADAAEQYKDSAAFVLAIYNSSAPRNQLRGLGCAHIVPYPVLFWKFWRLMPKEDRLELPERILSSVREIESGYGLLSDERSRQEFRAQLRWRCLLDYSCLPPHDDPREMYFPPDLFRISTDEVFVDCGAFDGDSLRAFLSASNGQFSRIYAWEADPANAARLNGCVLSLPSDISAKVTVMPYAVGRQDGTVRFSADGTVGSRVGTPEATQDVVCRSIDSAFAGHITISPPAVRALPRRPSAARNGWPPARNSSIKPSLIKMDIEGAEPDALLGAARTMARHRPIMAVCAYHKCDHLWSLPQLLKAANPDYEIFLRRYAEDCWETVYYAIPPERLCGNAGAKHAQEVSCDPSCLNP